MKAAFWADRSGATAVEFALALPVFLTLIFGVMEFSRILWSEHALSLATEEATRFALVNPTASSSTIEQVVRDHIVTIDKGDVTVTVVQETLDGINFLTVRAQYPFQSLMPYTPFGTFTLQGQSRIPL